MSEFEDETQVSFFTYFKSYGIPIFITILLAIAVLFFIITPMLKDFSRNDTDIKNFITSCQNLANEHELVFTRADYQNKECEFCRLPEIMCYHSENKSFCQKTFMDCKWYYLASEMSP